MCCGGAQRMHTRRALGGRACRSEGLWLMHILHAAYARSCSLSISILSNGSPLARVLFVTLCLTKFELHGPCPRLDDSGHPIDGGACGSQGMLYTAFASRSRETYRVY